MCLYFIVIIITVAPGPVIAYSLDSRSVSGTTVLNMGSAGSSYTATLVNGASISTSDYVVGTASVQLSGASSQYVQLPAFTSGSSGLSFACWFRSNGNSDYARIFDFGNGQQTVNIIMFITSNTLYVGYVVGVNNWILPVRLANDNVWRHVTWTLDTTGVWVVYINGVVAISQGGLPYPTAVSRANNYLGRSNWNSDPYFTGAIDEFRYYSRVITQSEAQALYTGSMMYTGYTLDSNSVSGTTVLNMGSAGSSYTATLVNGASISTSDYVVGTASVQLSGASSQYVQLPAFTSGSSGLSFACWFRSNGNSDYARIFDFGNGQQTVNIIMFITSNTLYVGYVVGVNNWILPVRLANDNVWRHVTWTLDTTGVWVVYINGVVAISQGGLPYPTAVSRANNYLGRSNWNSDPYFTGAIDEFRYYSRVITQSDVNNVFFCLSSPYPCPAGKLTQ